MEQLRFSSYTDNGERKINEDSCGIAAYGESRCFIVADGLGGHGKGDMASRIAVDTVSRIFSQQGFSDAFFGDAFSAVQSELLKKQTEMCAAGQMKTTLVVLVICGDMAYWAHTGDSRLYIFKNGKQKERTADHSVPQMLVAAGAIKEKEIRHHPDRNRLMHVLGVKGESPHVDEGCKCIARGKYSFLLCTDGYWEWIEESDMECMHRMSDDPGQWIDNMNYIIRGKGEGKEMDNLSAIAVFKGVQGRHREK
ncbi:MAG: serine/threonine-protein phosphatase [Oscillospiraceae bacterium]|nr:serine/threonine-protein phosphatase [Oscillospiraceae bacterium]